jgi:hypothetical protein
VGIFGSPTACTKHSSMLGHKTQQHVETCAQAHFLFLTSESRTRRTEPHSRLAECTHQMGRRPGRTAHAAAGSRGVPPLRCRTPPRQLPAAKQNAEQHQQSSDRLSTLPSLDGGCIKSRLQVPVTAEGKARARCGGTGRQQSLHAAPKTKPIAQHSQPMGHFS